MAGRSTHRLPPAVRPQSAELRLALSPRSKTFRGEVRYSLQLDRATRTIELHAADLVVARASARSPTGVVSKASVELDPARERVRLRFARKLGPGAVRLDLAFRGRVRRDLRGLYRSNDDADPWLATQLCPTDARRLFPAFDEPAIKLRYRIAATIPTEASVISNSPVEFEEPAGPGFKTVHFEPTPPLSAYVVALAVGPFEASPVLVAGATPIRVYTLPGRQHLASYAREVAAESLGRLERWFDSPHPYAKLDLVALPDFAFGAMENAGAVFFRDSVLLLDAQTASPAELFRSADTITHELAHMWFGNWVTMAWWNDLWLNESFATWMAHEILDGWQSDWRVWQRFAQRREEALEQDALATSHAIAPPIRDAAEAHENFDAITYTKGAAVLRMLEQYLGRERFREGVQRYLRRHHEGAATAADLWTALGEVADQPVEKILAPWTQQTGFPLVRVERGQEDERELIALTQSRFGAPPGDATRWPIPWVGRIGLGEDGHARAVRHLVTRRRERVSGQGASLSWIYGNAGEAGFFRVEHGESEWADLLAELPALSPLERIGLLGHQWALAWAGRAGLAPLLDLVAALGEEEDPDVLAAVEHVLGRALQRVAPSARAESGARLRAWIAVYFGGQVDRLGFAPAAGEDRATRERRARIFALVGGLGRAPSLARICHASTEQCLAGGREPAPELLDETIRIAAASQGDARLHARYVDQARRAATPQSRGRWLTALADFPGEAMVDATLAVALDAAVAPVGDRAALLTALLADPEKVVRTWARLARVWPALERAWPPILLARVVGATAKAFPPERSAELVRFFRARPLAAGGRTLAQIREQLGHAREASPRLARSLDAYLDPSPRPRDPARLRSQRSRSRSGPRGRS